MLMFPTSFIVHVPINFELSLFFLVVSAHFMMHTLLRATLLSGLPFVMTESVLHDFLTQLSHRTGFDGKRLVPHSPRVAALMQSVSTARPRDSMPPGLLVFGCWHDVLCAWYASPRRISSG